MRFDNLSMAGIMLGALFTVLSALRYFAIYPDLDKALAYCAIGVLVMAVSFVYGRQRKINDTLLAVEDYLADRPWEEGI